MTAAKNKQLLDELPSKFPAHLPALLQSPFIQLDSVDGIFNVQLKNITYCSGERWTTTFYTLVTTPVVVSKPLRHFERLLRAYGFERIQTGLLVNLNHVQACRRKEYHYEVMLNTGEKITILPAMQKKLLTALKRISGKNGRIAKQQGLQIKNADFMMQTSSPDEDYIFQYTYPSDIF